jgi:allophanate hydrolase
VSFALGTDTAGSGRVPAGFNNIVGLKPTPGLVSTAGVFPACRSLDCVSIFALTVANAALVLLQCQGYDAADIYSVTAPEGNVAFAPPHFTFGVPSPDQLRFFGNAEYGHVYAVALDGLEAIGGQRLEIDFCPFMAVADLLYAGPWVAERLVAVGKFFYDRPEALHPVTHAILASAEKFSAGDAFAAHYQLRALARRSAAVWQQVDLLALPTTGTIYTRQEVAADPVNLNTTLGYYTNFVNLLGLSALALPAGFTNVGLPVGLTLVAPGFAEQMLVAIGSRFQHHIGVSLGATGNPLPT